MIIEFTFGIEKENVWSTGRPKSLGYGLILIEEIGKGIARPQSLRGHLFRGILGIGLGIITIDTDDNNSLFLPLPRQLSQLGRNMKHIGTMVAKKEHQQRPPCRLAGRPLPSLPAQWQAKARQGSSQR